MASQIHTRPHTVGVMPPSNINATDSAIADAGGSASAADDDDDDENDNDDDEDEEDDDDDDDDDYEPCGPLGGNGGC